jgi:hypothetical protein
MWVTGSMLHQVFDGQGPNGIVWAPLIYGGLLPVEYPSEWPKLPFAGQPLSPGSTGHPFESSSFHRGPLRGLVSWPGPLNFNPGTG